MPVRGRIGAKQLHWRLTARGRSERALLFMRLRKEKRSRETCVAMIGRRAGTTGFDSVFGGNEGNNRRQGQTGASRFDAVVRSASRGTAGTNATGTAAGNNQVTKHGREHVSLSLFVVRYHCQSTFDGNEPRALTMVGTNVDSGFDGNENRDGQDKQMPPFRDRCQQILVPSSVHGRGRHRTRCVVDGSTSAQP